MRTTINSLKLIGACIVLLNVGTPLAEATGPEAVNQLTVQQCSLEEETPLLLVHGRHRHHHHHPYPPSPYYSPPHYHSSVYPPPYPYYVPVSGICRNQVFFCHMNTVLPVGSPCVCYAPFGVVWFSGQVTAY